jgi:hypothetical protein
MRTWIWLVIYLCVNAVCSAEERQIVLPKISTLGVEFSNQFPLDRQIKIDWVLLDEEQNLKSLSKLGVPRLPLINWEKLITIVPVPATKELTVDWRVTQEYRGNLSKGKWKFELLNEPVITELKQSIPDQLAANIGIIDYGNTTEKYGEHDTECRSYLIAVGLNQPDQKWSPSTRRVQEEVAKQLKTREKFNPLANEVLHPVSGEQSAVGAFAIRWKIRANGSYDYQQEVLHWSSRPAPNQREAEKSRAKWSEGNPRPIAVPDVEAVFPGVGPVIKF